VENLAPTGIDPQTVQPVASRYTDYAIPAPIYIYIYLYAYAHFGIFWRAALALGSNRNTTSVSYCCSVCTTYLQARSKVMGER